MTDLEKLHRYLRDTKGYTAYVIEKTALRFGRNSDILAELCLVLDGVTPKQAIVEQGYSAASLMLLYPKVFPEPYGAYSFLIMLRESPDVAMDLIKKGFPVK